MAVFIVAVVAVMAWRYLEAAMGNFMLATDTLLVVSPVVDTAFTAKGRPERQTFRMRQKQMLRRGYVGVPEGATCRGEQLSKR